MRVQEEIYNSYYNNFPSSLIFVDFPLQRILHRDMKAASLTDAPKRLALRCNHDIAYSG